MDNYPKISVRISSETLEQLRALARLEGHTLGYLVREAVEQYLEKKPS